MPKLPLSKEPLTQALRNVSDEKWRSHQNQVSKTPLSRYLSPSGVEQQNGHGRFAAVTPPSSGSRSVTGFGSPGHGRIFPGTCRALELKDVNASTNRADSASASPVSGTWKRVVPPNMYGSPYLREDEQPNPRSTLPTAVATFTPTGNIKVELKIDGVELGTPKKRFAYASADGSTPESPGTPVSSSKRLSSVSSDLRTPTPRRKRPVAPNKRLLSESECDDSSVSPASAAATTTSRRSAATTAKTRVDGSLVTITQGFIDLLSASETKSLDINKVAVKLGIPKRRIYDITNALEGIGFLKKGVKNVVHWTGVNANSINPDHQTLASEVSAMKEETVTLDHLIKAANEQFQKIVRDDGSRLWVTHEDLVAASKDVHKSQERLLLPVHAPVGTSIECSSHKNHNVYLKSTDGPITVSLLSAGVKSESGHDDDGDRKPFVPSSLSDPSPSFGTVKTETSGSRDEQAPNLMDSPTSNLMRLLDSPIKGLDHDWRRPMFGQGTGQCSNMTLGNTGSTTDPSEWIDSLPLELQECDYNFAMDGSEGLSNLFDFM